MIVNGVEVLTALEARVAPTHTALLVVDMQNDYCAPGGASDRNGRPLVMIQGIVPALRRLVETGVMTQTCVETTVRDALCYDYYVSVAEDCAASGTPAQHETSIRNMAT